MSLGTLLAMRVLTGLTAAEEQAIRDRIAGRPIATEAKRPRNPEQPKTLLSQYHRYEPRTGEHVIQLPIAFDRRFYNASRAPVGMRERHVKGLREQTWQALDAYLPHMRGASEAAQRRTLTALAFHRFGPRDLDRGDNLPAAFKPVVDAVCCWLVWGAHAHEHTRAIGSYDDRVDREWGVQWKITQGRALTNARAHGVQIRLRFGAPSVAP